ncbi:hypothetical protein SNE40_017713 [Patella caerulea]|uniref:Prokineticin domain-containing protein n=1 Tax=Patella caerulea TaxID=87958 RepID=A0AAN8JAX5_PATCE
MKIFLCLTLFVALAAAKDCGSDAECEENECCLHPMFGKRFIFEKDPFGHSTGTCTTKPTQGESCEPPEIHDPFNPKLHEWHCPCVEGFVCHGDTEVHHSGSHSYTNPTCKVMPSAPTMTTEG